LESLSVACAVASYFTLGRAGWLARLYFRLTGVATREEAEVTFIRFITAIIAVFIPPRFVTIPKYLLTLFRSSRFTNKKA